jgi:uncharacterized membrane protein YgdD (TMEM256/DUF423 family)
MLAPKKKKTDNIPCPEPPVPEGPMLKTEAMMEKFCLIWSGVHGFIGVSLGAFAAHWLKTRLDTEALAWIETGSRYQLIHALALLGVAALGSVRLGETALSRLGWEFGLGTALFSGSLYLMAFSNWRWLGMLTPLGGLLLLLGWLGLIISSLKSL